MGKLEGRVAIVTGAGRGVGRAYAEALAAHGAKVLVNDAGSSVSGSGTAGTGAVADETVASIQAAGGIAAPNCEDISSYVGAENLIQQAISTFGRLDILVANAGIIRPTNMHEAKEEDWSQVLAVHANGTFNCYRHAAPVMIKQRRGTIITTGADVDRYLSRRDAFPGLAAYRAAKAAILVLTLAAADELRPYNINVNSIMPGGTATRMQQAFVGSLRARGLSEETVQTTYPKPVPTETVPPLGVFLCTDEGREITGRAFTINGPRVTVLTGPSPIATLYADHDSWTVDALATRLPRWLAG